MTLIVFQNQTMKTRSCEKCTNKINGGEKLCRACIEKMYRELSEVDREIREDTGETNYLLAIIQPYERTWDMEFNLSKCQVFHITQANKLCCYS